MSCRFAISVNVLQHAALMTYLAAGCKRSLNACSAFSLCLLPVCFCLLCLPLASCQHCVRLPSGGLPHALPAVSRYVLASWWRATGVHACLACRATACLHHAVVVSHPRRDHAAVLHAYLSCSMRSACVASAYHYMMRCVETICKGNASVFGDVVNATMAMYEPPHPLPRDTGTLPSLDMSSLRNIGDNRKWQ